MTLGLECSFELDGVGAADMWQLLSTTRPDILSSDLPCDLGGRPCLVKEVATKLAAARKQYFTVQCDAGQFDYAPLGAYGFSRLQITQCIDSTEDACCWMDALLSIPSFLVGRLYDEEYEFWQNARDPIEYEARSQPYDHLPMRSNGFPPPLEQMEIDTSRNPGRRELQIGRIEAVGSPMWLGAKFLRIGTITESDLRSQEWLHTEILPSEAWKLRVCDSPFTSDKGEQAELQDKLRALLF